MRFFHGMGYCLTGVRVALDHGGLGDGFLFLELLSMLYAYIRVSTEKQTVENQRFEIQRFCASHQLDVNVWCEETVSGNAPLSRRKLGRLLRRLKPDDVFLCTEISRLGRNLFTIMDVLAKCMRKKVKLMTIKDHFCLVDDLQCKVLAFAFGLASEIERKLIAQRTTESLARLKAEGKKLGRPKGSPNHKHKLSGKEEVILEGLRSHQSQTQIAKKLKVHRNTLRKFIEDNHLCP